MISSDTQRMIPLLQHALDQQPVSKAWLFGSASRGEESADSDVDILVQYIDSDNMSLMGICRVKRALEHSINRTVDLVEDGQLLPFATESVNKDKILIYERSN